MVPDIDCDTSLLAWFQILIKESPCCFPTRIHVVKGALMYILINNNCSCFFNTHCTLDANMWSWREQTSSFSEHIYQRQLAFHIKCFLLNKDLSDPKVIWWCKRKEISYLKRLLGFQETLNILHVKVFEPLEAVTLLQITVTKCQAVALLSLRVHVNLYNVQLLVVIFLLELL